MDEELDEQPGTRTEPSPPAHVASPVPGTLAARQVLVGRYEIRSRIGAGGMGFVYRAHDRALDEEVALKVLFPERLGARSTLRRLRREVKLARKVTHPNVCRVFDIGEDGDIWFLTMELVEGRTVRSILADGNLPPARALTILEKVAAGLAAAHAQGVVHLDLKPDNIMVRPDGRVVVVDFGVARSMLTGHSTTGGIAGTLAYMSPEHLRGGPLDVRSDVYSLGVVAFELLTGVSAPPASWTAPDGGAHRERGERPVVAGLAPETARAIEGVLARACAKQPEDRFATVDDFSTALAAARRGASPTMPDAPSGGGRATDTLSGGASAGTARRGARRQVAAMALAALTGAVAVVITWGASRAPGMPGVEGHAASAHQPAPPDLSEIAAKRAERPGVAVSEFDNLTGDPSWDALAKGAVEAVRAGLRTMPEIRVLDDDRTDGVPDDHRAQRATWILTGSVQRVGNGLRLAAQLRAADGSTAGEPIEVDGEPTQPALTLERLRQRALDEARLLWRAYDRRRHAEHGTSSIEARSSLLQYYTMVGLGAGREHLEPGMALLDKAISGDGDYIPALVERAYLRATIAATRSRVDDFKLVRADLDHAIAVAPGDLQALVMRCRLSQTELHPKHSPTDQDIRAVIQACESAIQAHPTSAYVPFVMARIHDLRCEDELAIASLERALELDRSLSGRILGHLVMIALRNEQYPLADQMSRRLVEFQAEEDQLGARSLNRRAGVPPTRLSHLIRAAVLLRMQRLDEARIELDHELQIANRRGNPWGEPAAIRGILRIARQRGEAPPPGLSQRLATLEQNQLANLARDPHSAEAIAEAYVLVDGPATVTWLNKLPRPGSFLHAFNRARTYLMAGDRKAVKELLTAFGPQAQWEKTCEDWIQAKLSR